MQELEGGRISESAVGIASQMTNPLSSALGSMESFTNLCLKKDESSFCYWKVQLFFKLVHLVVPYKVKYE